MTVFHSAAVKAGMPGNGIMRKLSSCVLLTLVVLATAEFPEGIKAAIPKGLQVKTASQGVPFAHAVQG